MTTIAFNNKSNQIACESQSTANGIIATNSAIKYREVDGEYWFFAGTVSDYDDMLGLKHNDLIKPIPDCSAYQVTDGKVWLVVVNNDGYCEKTLLDHDDANGSGQSFALAAMDHGRTAKQAVEYACTRDIYSGGKVWVFDIASNKFIEED